MPVAAFNALGPMMTCGIIGRATAWGTRLQPGNRRTGTPRFPSWCRESGSAISPKRGFQSIVQASLAAWSWCS